MFLRRFAIIGTAFAFVAGSLISAVITETGDLKVETIPEPLLRLQSTTRQDGSLGWFVNNFDSVTDTTAPTLKSAVRVYLSKDRYDAEDLGLTVVCVLPVSNMDAKDYAVALELQTIAGERMSAVRNAQVTANQFAVDYPFPKELAGADAILQITVRKKSTGQSEIIKRPFSVAKSKRVATRGSVPIHLPGKPEVAGVPIPYSVGIPFPKGALAESSRLRLVNESGIVVAASFEIDGKWSRFGGVRWLKCFFTLPVPETDSVLKLEYGGASGELPKDSAQPEQRWDGRFSGRYLELRAGVIGARATPDESLHSLLKASSLAGAYVVDGNDRKFATNQSGKSMVERTNAQQLVVRQKGWYEAGAEEKYCQFDNRITLFKDAPLIRIEHTWIFTGDGNQDVIAEMGWRFSSATPLGKNEFWQSDDTWLPASRLLQYRHDQAILTTEGSTQTLAQRSSGIGRVCLDNSTPGFVIAVKDFWRNFPGELIGDADGYSVLTWPRHGKPDDTPVSVRNAYKLSFIHSGEKLNFRLPESYLKKPVYDMAEAHYREGKAESANAQGIAKTTEIWLYVGDSTNSGALLQGLCDRTLSAYADPQWIAASGAFHEIHAKDTANFPKEEAAYEAVALAPERWAERMEVYGKWIWGDVLSMPNLKDQTLPGNFRAFRKAHQGWPYSWLSYARSGDVRFRRFAEASTRHMADVAFCHYSDKHAARPLGFWNRSLIPWTFISGPTSRHYVDKVDYLWAAWHLTDDHRARETALQWGEATKTSKMPILPWSGNRRSVNMLKSYVDSYEETLLPWFIPAYREVAALHQQQDADSKSDAWQLGGASFWNSGPREYLRFTGDESYSRLYLNYANYWGSPACDNIWVQYGMMPLEALSHAHALTGDMHYAQRIRGYLDWATTNIYDGPEEWMKGFFSVGVNRLEQGPLFAGYFLSQFPFAQQALSQAAKPSALPNNVFVMPDYDETRLKGQHELAYPRIYFSKQGSVPVPLELKLASAPARETPRPWLYEVRSPGESVASKGTWKLEEPTGTGKQKPQAPFVFSIPSDAPEGTYTVNVRHVFEDLGKYRWGFTPSLMMPISDEGVPEVFEWPRGRDLPPISVQSQLWFRWPENEQTLTLRFHFPSALNEVQMPAVLNGIGDVLWSERFTTERSTKGHVIECRLDRASAGPDGMIQVVFPGRDIRWQVLGEGELYFAVSKTRWFQPQPGQAAQAASLVTK